MPSLYLGILGGGEQACRNTIFQNWIDVLDAAPKQGLNARTFSVFDRDVRSLKENFWNRIHHPSADMAFANVTSVVRVSARLQGQIQRIPTICALERYRLKNGRYPDELAALMPEFLPAVPTEIATLQPLHYRREGSGFVLWTPGWNERDEGGAGDDGNWIL